MLNPLPLRLNADGEGLRIGFPALDPADDRVLDDIGWTQDRWAAAMRRPPRLGWAAIGGAMLHAAGALRSARRALAHE